MQHPVLLRVWKSGAGTQIEYPAARSRYFNQEKRRGYKREKHGESG
jgi:hypothetical protein